MRIRIINAQYEYYHYVSKINHSSQFTSIEIDRHIDCILYRVFGEVETGSRVQRQ